MLCQDGAKVNSRCVLLAVGVILSLVVYGLLQERIMTESYNNQVFDSAVFLVFCNRSLGVLCGMLAVLWQKEPLRSGAPVWKYAIVSFSNVFASSCQYEALKYVSFTVQMLGKSFKMIPVMLWGIIIDGKSYSVQDWIVAAAITGGVVEFLIMGPTTSHRLQHAPEYDRPGYGYFLMVSFLALDGLTSSLQEKLFKEHQTTRSNQWLYVNACSCIITGLLLVAEGAFMPSLDFLFQHHVFATDTVVLSSSAVVSQFFIYAQVQEFGALAYAATMNARQVFSILGSYAQFGHSITGLQIMGLLLVFVALGYNSIKIAMESSMPEKQRILQEAAPEDSDSRLTGSRPAPGAAFVDAVP